MHTYHTHKGFSQSYFRCKQRGINPQEIKSNDFDLLKIKNGRFMLRNDTLIKFAFIRRYFIFQQGKKPAYRPVVGTHR